MIYDAEIRTSDDFKNIFSKVANPLELAMGTKLFTAGILFVYQKKIELNGHSYGRSFVVIDFFIPDSNLLIEVDGKQHYADQEQIFKDVERNNFLVGMGYRIFQFSWDTVMSTRENWDVMRMVRRGIENG